VIRTRYAAVRPYVTRDGSLIRELLHPAQHGNVRQSLAEAEVAPGASTQLHYHTLSEELYHVVAGQGLMQLGTEQFTISVGDTVCIPPGTPHCITNTAATALRILCCCTPPYGHDDTILVTTP
jgi:mannose-6-phosphate isomerase-like protein (cupin superfamily)